jgi:replicative DNA helicase
MLNNIQDIQNNNSKDLDINSNSLPHSIEAEEALLGSILVDNEVYNRITFDLPLKSEHFFVPVHGRIYEAVQKLINNGQIADSITLGQYFEKDPALVEIDGSNHLVKLTESSDIASSTDHYAQLIYDLSLRRNLIRLAQEIVTEAANPNIDESANSQIEMAESKLFTLAETGEVNKGPLSFSESIAETISSAESAHNRDGKLSGISTGLKAIDELLGGLHKSDLIIIAGRPSMGKTALATNIAFQAAKKYKNENDDAILFCSLEMSSIQLTNRILAEEAKISSEKIRRGQLNNDEFINLVRASQNIQERKLFIDETPALSIPQLRTRARRIKRIHGLKLIVVDYLQLMNAINNTNNRVQEISEITQGLKAIAKELDVPVLALSQLSRAVEQREDKRPQLADLRESGTIEQDSDVVMFVYRQSYYEERAEPRKNSTETDDKFHNRYLEWQETLEKVQNTADVIIAKQRHGPIGNIKLHFEPSLTKFSDLAEDYRKDNGN